MLISDSLNARYLGFHSVYFIWFKKHLVLSLFVLFFPVFLPFTHTLRLSSKKRADTSLLKPPQQCT